MVPFRDIAKCAGVVAVEWPERLTRGAPGAIHIHIADTGGDTREIKRNREDTK